MSLEFKVVENPEPQAWDDLVCACRGHLLQSAEWGELKRQFGWSVHQVALTRNGKAVAGAQVLFRRLPLGLSLGYIPRGPMGDPGDSEAMTALHAVLERVARAHGAFALKVEPDWLASTPVPQTLLTGALPARRVQPGTTVHVDLTPALAEILARMKSKWRYNIRLAERKGVSVREGGAGDVPVFYRLLQVTATRDRFAIHSPRYYQSACDLLQDKARLFIAEYEHEPLAGIFVTAFGDEAIYLYGASGNTQRERMPNHALHWAAIQWAKERRCKRYDLWGIAETSVKRSSEPQHNTSALPEGLYQFKQGFGGQVVQYAGAFDLVFSRARYELYKRALAVRQGLVA